MNERLFTVSSDENEVVPWSIKVDGYFKKKSEEENYQLMMLLLR